MLATVAACDAVPSTSSTTTPTPTSQVVVEVHLDYGIMPFEQIIENSQAIFLGKVTDISGTSWNQDDGTYWGGGLPVYSIQAEVLQPIVDTLGMPEQVTVTQVGYSPLEHGPAASLAAGQRAVFFVVQVDIAWRGGPRRVLRTTNTDTDSILIVGDDRYPGQLDDQAARLESILHDIAARREILPQPPAAAVP
jgi:hypothetical protein